VSHNHTPGSPVTQPPAEPGHFKPNLTTPPFVNSASTSPPRIMDYRCANPQSPRLLTSPLPAHAPLSPPPPPTSAIVHGCLFIPFSTSHYQRTSTLPVPSAPTSDPSAPPTLPHPSALAHLLPVSSMSTSPTLGCDRDKSQSEEVGLSLAPKGDPTWNRSRDST